MPYWQVLCGWRGGHLPSPLQCFPQTVLKLNPCCFLHWENPKASRISDPNVLISSAYVNRPGQAHCIDGETEVWDTKQERDLPGVP